MVNQRTSNHIGLADGILERPLAAAYLNYLKVKGFLRLYELAVGQVTYKFYISGIDAVEVARAAAEAARLDNLWEPVFVLAAVAYAMQLPS